jgi:hypothetical protein
MTNLERPTKLCLGVGNGPTVGFTCFWLRSRHLEEEVFLAFAILLLSLLHKLELVASDMFKLRP